LTEGAVVFPAARLGGGGAPGSTLARRRFKSASTPPATMTPANPRTIAERLSTADDTPIAVAASHNAAAVPTATNRKRIPVMVHLAPCCAAVYGRFDRPLQIDRAAPSRGASKVLEKCGSATLRGLLLGIVSAENEDRLLLR